MTSREDSGALQVDELLRELTAWAQQQPDILALYLYGSHARGEASAMSDVDVAIFARDDLSREELWRLEDEWSVRWPEVVDIRVLNLAPLPFRYEVTAQGRRLWAADPGSVADVESLIWRKYWDVQPQLERDWERYVQHFMERRSEAERREYQATLANVRAVHRRVREAAGDYKPAQLSRGTSCQTASSPISSSSA
jgi:predicted nucleotidyltransferase